MFAGEYLLINLARMIVLRTCEINVSKGPSINDVTHERGVVQNMM